MNNQVIVVFVKINEKVILETLGRSQRLFCFLRKKFFLKIQNKSIGALDLIRKCLTASPSDRFTIDDIAIHWWVNVGYKYPPVYYYDALVMERNRTMTSSHPPSTSTSHGIRKRGSTSSENKAKTTPTPVSTYTRQTPSKPSSTPSKPSSTPSKPVVPAPPPPPSTTLPPPPPPPPPTSLPSSSHPPSVSARVPPPLVQNGHLTDTELKTQVQTNGYHQIIRSHRLNGNPIPTISNNNKNEIYKPNQSNRWISNDKPNGGLPSIKQPIPRMAVY